MPEGMVKQGDVPLNSTGMITIGRSQCPLEEVSAVVDNHMAIIRPTAELDPVYLACFLNSLPGQMQTERRWTGSSGQIELRPDLVADYRIWKAPIEVQRKICGHIEQSHAVRREA
jgi:restriction endonuclease S subunit